MCETARYLTIQIFHTALQFRSVLSFTGEDVLGQLFRHIEPSALSPILFCRPPNTILSPHVNVFLELIDHPHLLYTDVNFACQLYVVVSTLSTACRLPRGCTQFITALSDLRLPYSSIAVVCSALEEAANALSILVHGDESAPGNLRYAKPPYPILPIDKPPNGAKILQQSDFKVFAFRSAIGLCHLLLRLCRFCSGGFEERHSAHGYVNDGSLRYIVQACIKTIHLARTFGGSALSLASKLERVSLQILSHFTSVGFPPDMARTASVNIDVTELVLSEILDEGRTSPGQCDTAASILSFLMADWRSEEILINNRLCGSLRESLRKCGPEFTEVLSIWDGNCQQSRWLLAGGRDITMRVWDEALSQVEFWLSRGHSRYTLKWLRVLRVLLARSGEKRSELVELGKIVSGRELGMTFEEWVENMSHILPEAEAECQNEIDELRALCRGYLAKDSKVSTGMSALKLQTETYRRDGH
jgi:hypothetical protein